MSSGGSIQAVIRSSRALALQHDSTALNRDPRRRRTALHGGPIGLPNSRPRSEFRALEPRSTRLSPNTLLARAWPCVIELRIDDALATVAQFEAEIARADGAVGPRSREIAAILRAVLLVLKSQEDATVRAAVAGLLISLHHATPQDSVPLPELGPEIGPEIGSILPGRAERLRESLSPREHSILRSMSRGLSNKRIAQELQIAPETVKSHVKRIFIKLAVQSRAHAVSTAGALGML